MRAKWPNLLTGIGEVGFDAWLVRMAVSKEFEL